MSNLSLRVLLLCLSLLGIATTFTGCEVAELPSGADARDTRDTRDSALDSADELDSGLVACDPSAVDPGCADGQYCETTARVCVDCVGYIQRCIGAPASAQRETCVAPTASGPGLVEGGFYEPEPCGSGEVCTTTGQIGAPVRCDKQVCEAGFSTCLSAGSVKACNAAGTVEAVSQCGAGQACYTGTCEPIRHNVVLIFDTSASMWSYVNPAWNTGPGGASYTPIQCEGNPWAGPVGDRHDGPDGAGCFEDFPDCDDEASPLSSFTLSKNVFTSVVRDAIGRYAQFALQRFPQRDMPGVGPSCGSGWYAAQDEITGDDDLRTTDGSTWFKDNLGQVMVVPFPVRTTIDNTTTLLRWIDHKELLGAGPDACTVASDCGDGGRCADYNGQKRCYNHTDPELRAMSQTPLGKSLFYAGEYIRRFVRVDGKACTTDASCDSAGYLCRDLKCVDPYRKCKDDFIVLFTDGGESFHAAETDFFSPVVQAKRLAFGLDCQGDGDCRGDAKCSDNRCIGKDQTTLDTPNVAGEGFGALSAPDGTPISIKTTVITLNSLTAMNARIAYAGGGASVDVSAGDPESFQSALLSAMTPNYKCRPEDLP